MVETHDWLYFLFPAPILYVSSVIVAGTILWLMLKGGKSRKPSLLAAWLGATLAALVPQVLAAFVLMLQVNENGFVYPSLSVVAGAGLVVVGLRRIFDIGTGKAVLIYVVCLAFQALPAIPFYLRDGLRLFMPSFYVYCVMLIVSLPIFMAFRSFKIAS
jgi:hypothetical protein